MKLVIKTPRHKFWFPIPIFLLKSKLAYKALQKEFCNYTYTQYKEIFRQVRHYVADYGHFVLLEVTTNDIYIKVTL